MDDYTRRTELAAILGARPADAAMLERMVYGPQPLTDASRDVLAVAVIPDPDGRARIDAAHAAGFPRIGA